MKKYPLFCSVVVILFLMGCGAAPPLRVHFLSVGHGDCIVLELPHDKHVLIDAGSVDTGETIVEYLKELGVNTIDVAIITHPHDNHYGGFFRLLDALTIKELYVNNEPQAEEQYQQLLDLFKERNIPIRTARRETIIPLKAAEIIVLHPRALTRGINDNALVMKLIYRKTSFLFWSDVGPAVQREIIETFGRGRLLRSHLTLLPHHGDLPAQETLELAQRSIHVISTGPYRLPTPHPETLRALEEQVVYRTDLEGHLVFESDGVSVQQVPSNA